MDKGLGRRVPTSWKHVEKYPLRTLLPPTTLDKAEKIWSLPYWHKSHDQGAEGSCVGHGWAMERGIVNTRQNVLAHLPWPKVRRYNPLHIWETAKTLDEWPDTNPGDDNGTSVHAGGDVLRTQGAQRVKSMRLGSDGLPHPSYPRQGAYPVDPREGIAAVRWATTVDEMRFAIQNFGPVVIGINWYSNFDDPVLKNGARMVPEFWIGEGDLGSIRGGHCICLYGVSDRRQAFKVKNSWGDSYPEVWLPYTAMTTLLGEDGEAAIVTDL
jgi:hypothetical protein